MLSTHGHFLIDHYVEQCVLCFLERKSSFSCAFTFERALFLLKLPEISSNRPLFLMSTLCQPCVICLLIKKMLRVLLRQNLHIQIFLHTEYCVMDSKAFLKSMGQNMPSGIGSHSPEQCPR